MKTQDLIQKITDFGMTKYGLAKEIGVSWHCIHAYQKGWYEAGWENFTKLQMVIDRLIKSREQMELFDPIKMHNDETLDKWLKIGVYKK